MNTKSAATRLVTSLNVFVSTVLCSTAFAQQAADAPVQTAGTAAAGGTGMSNPAWMQILLFGGMFFFMWLFILRPQGKKQKEHKNFLDSLKSGQEVITSGGLIGKITSVSDSIVTVDLGTSSVRVLKSAISGELGHTPAQQS